MGKVSELGVNINRFIVVYIASHCGWKGEWMEVYVYVVRNVLVFESADVGLKHVNPLPVNLENMVSSD